MDPIVKFINISKCFGGVDALSEVSMDIYPGEVHSIVGENGAGKSTLMNVLEESSSRPTAVSSLKARKQVSRMRMRH